MAFAADVDAVAKSDVVTKNSDVVTKDGAVGEKEQWWSVHTKRVDGADVRRTNLLPRVL